MKKESVRPSIVINSYHQELIAKLLSKYESWNDLPAELAVLCNEYNFNLLKNDLNDNTPVGPKFNKLMVVVDYINAFVDGSLGSTAAKSIEDKLTERVRKAVEDPDTAVIVLIDAHYGDNSYLNSREGRHLPVPHANNELERKLHGKLHELFSDLYDSVLGNYEDDINNGIWFVEKSQFGYPNMTNVIDGHIIDAMDKVGELANLSVVDQVTELIGENGNYLWHTAYDTVNNLSIVTFIPDEITIVGVATNICVLSNAILLQNEYPQVEIYVPEDSVASYDESLHKAALNVMKGLGINIIDNEEK